MSKVLFWFAILVYSLPRANSVNVLVLSPSFAASHMNFMANLAETLAKAGHNVTLLIPVADESRRNYSKLKWVKDVVFVDQDEQMKREAKPVDLSMDVLWESDLHYSKIYGTNIWICEVLRVSCGNFLRNSAVFEEMKKRQFDVAIAEPLTVCGLGFFHKLGIQRVILATSCVHYDTILKTIGEPAEVSYVPALLSLSNDKMSLTERFENHQASEETDRALLELFEEETKIYRKYLGQNIPHWKDLLNAASLHFVNSNPFLDFPRPVFQKTVPIGGISVNMEEIRAQKLPEEWNKILGQRTKNILISFGSMVKSYEMPFDWRQNILEAIKANPEVTFIWKYESNDTKWAEGVENVYFEKWVPQPALLADQRVTAFLTHGGLGSTYEVAHFGKPAIMIPIFADQVRNSHMMARHENSILLLKNELANGELVKKAIRQILYDESYKSNATRIAEILANQPSKPKDLVIKYTEFVAKYGPFPQMDPFGRHLNFFTRNSLDIYIIALLTTAIIIVFAIVLIVKTARFVISRRLKKIE